MTTYESEIKTISSNEEMVFSMLSNLQNLEKLNDNPGMKDKVSDLQFDADSFSFTVVGFGKMSFRIVERVPFKTIKFISEKAPVVIDAWIQLKQVAENKTCMKLTLKAELTGMIKMMVDKKLNEGINSLADMLAKTLNKGI
jgi:carbon monoxide dehydrogenase subunit G